MEHVCLELWVCVGQEGHVGLSGDIEDRHGGLIVEGVDKFDEMSRHELGVDIRLGFNLQVRLHIWLEFVVEIRFKFGDEIQLQEFRGKLRVQFGGEIRSKFGDDVL